MCKDKLIFRPPYTPDGKFAFQFKNYRCPGVYFIEENGEMVYIGYGSNAYMALIRHFQTWNDRIPRATYNRANCCIDIIRFDRMNDAHQFEIKMIKQYRPRDNSRKYEEYVLNEDFTPERENKMILSGPCPF